MKERLAVLVPVRNGGQWLLRTVASCGASGLNSEQAEILVLDNCSDDGAVEALPAFSGSLPVRVLRNPRDLGRVGNWNRAVAAAAEREFAYITFLFAGDTWIGGEGVSRLLEQMRSARADLGLAPYLMVDEAGRVRRRSARVSIDGECRAFPARRFLRALLDRGALPITPLQANIYRLRGDGLPRFDENRPLTTDMDATLEYLASGTGSVAIATEPFCAWLVRPGRVFCSSGLEAFMADHFRQLRHAETISGFPVNWSKAKSAFVLAYAQNAWTFAGWRRAPGVLKSAIKKAREVPGALNLVDLAALVLRRAVARKSVVHLA